MNPTTTVNNQIIGGRYAILRQLGAGGWGKTYLAEDLQRLGSHCVIKQLINTHHNPGILKKAQELFEREGKTLIQLGNHPQIPFLFAYFEENNEFYLIEEYIEGESFAQELESKGQLDENLVIDFLMDTLIILKYVHGNGIIHRDLKPDNIMRRQSDQKFVLIDFGGVKEVFNNNCLNQPSPNLLTQISTTGYTPQEQVNGYPEFNSDIYALGMTAIRALTGVEPRDLERNRKNKSVNWKESRIKVSSRLSNVIDKMIQENSEDRYQRVEEVLSDLSATEQTLIVARPTPNTQLTFINSIIQTRIPRTNIPLGLIFVCLVPFVAIGGFIVGFKVFYQPNILPALPTKTSDVQNSTSPQIPQKNPSTSTTENPNMQDSPKTQASSGASPNFPSSQIPQKNPSTSATENPSMQGSPTPQASSELSPKARENSDSENILFKRPKSFK